MYENFLSLGEEKKDKIINAALKVFAKNGYKKAAVDDIVAEADISKGAIFYYFDSKKNLYVYVYNFCMELLIDEFKYKYDWSETDFFLRLRKAQRQKLYLLTKYPNMYDFAISAYYEDSAAVKDEIGRLNKKGLDVGTAVLTEGVDTTKFKDGVDIVSVIKLVTWAGDGYLKEMKALSVTDPEAAIDGFDKYMEIIKQTVYKGEYL